VIPSLLLSLVVAFIASLGTTPRVEEKSFKIHYGAHLLTMPRSYFERGQSPSGVDQPDSLFFRLFMPDYTTAPTRPPSERGGFGDVISVELLARAFSLNRWYAFEAQGRTDDAVKDAYGLRTFRAASRYARRGSKQILLQQQDGAITTLIVCEPNSPSPHCEHWFRDAEYVYKARYNMRFLPAWRDTEDRLRATVAGFVSP